MNILILSALDESTGNATTARRIAAHLSAAHEVTVINVHETDLPSLKERVKELRIEAAIGLHALLAGPWLHALKIPYALIMGGTDLYQNLHELQVKLMVRSVLAASEVIAFGDENLQQAFSLWPEIKGRGRCIAQAVDISEIDRSFNIRKKLGLSDDSKLAILPAGIRAIKDPFHLAEAFHQFNLANPNVHMCIVGPILETEFAQENLAIIKDFPGVHHIAGLPRPHMLAAIEQADLLLNSSHSEGMSSAILEAMTLKTPVVARVNDGNVSIVEHKVRGYLYTEASEALNYVSILLNSPDERAHLQKGCEDYLLKRHSIEKEFNEYNDVLLKLARSK